MPGGSPGGQSPGGCDKTALHFLPTFKIHSCPYPPSGSLLLQSSRNRCCLAALLEELTLYETFPKWAHLPHSATGCKNLRLRLGSALTRPQYPPPPLVSKPLTLKLKPLAEPTP